MKDYLLGIFIGAILFCVSILLSNLFHYDITTIMLCLSGISIIILTFYKY